MTLAQSKNSKMLTKQSLKRPNFSPDEFFVSDTVYRLNNDKDPNNDIKNYPKENEQEVLENLMLVADMMQDIRYLLGEPIKINSAYRCKELNDIVGSTDRSQHLQGLACDFVCPRFGKPRDIVQHLFKKGVVVDQCFDEGSWVHISKVKQGNRMMYGFFLPDKTGKRAFKPL